MRPDELETDRQAVLRGQPDRQSHPWYAGKVRRNRRDVVQVHRHRVGQLLAEAEGGRRRARADQHIRLLERRREVALDECANLLGAAVVGVVVSRAQRVRAEDDAALDLGAVPALPPRDSVMICSTVFS